MMPLLGSAAMLLTFDVDDESIDEHDRWHTHEHLPERLSIPGFRRGTRWTAAAPGSPRYMVLYEVDDLATLTSASYLARLNSPTPWTARIMPHYRGMCRGLCSVLGSVGHGQGGFAALLRFTPAEPQRESLEQWLLDEVMPALPRASGLGSACLLRGAKAAPMTNEQRIRGLDRGVDSALILTGYDAAEVAGFAQALVEADGLAQHGAGDIGLATYQYGYSLASSELSD